MHATKQLRLWLTSRTMMRNMFFFLFPLSTFPISFSTSWNPKIWMSEFHLHYHNFSPGSDDETLFKFQLSPHSDKIIILPYATRNHSSLHPRDLKSALAGYGPCIAIIHLSVIFNDIQRFNLTLPSFGMETISLASQLSPVIYHESITERQKSIGRTA